MTRKARVEGSNFRAAKPIVGYPASEDLAAIVEAFKQAHPDDWEAARLGPLCDGLDHMIAKLKG